MDKLTDHRYLESKDKFLGLSYLALQDQFSTKSEFVSFFQSIDSDEQKNLFLKIASFYLFLVKRGDWLVDIPEVSHRVDYLTNTYKYIAIFSLIESLQDKHFLDFYSFLVRRKADIKFPIKNKRELNHWYCKYKEEFGSIKQSICFFESLSPQRKTDLIKNLEVRDTEPTIANLSKYLYDLRSQFVHEAKLIVNMSETTTISRKGEKFVICRLSIKNVMEFFEEGLIEHFRRRET